VDTETVDRQFSALQQQAQQTAKLIQTLADKLSAATSAGDPNAREWALDLKEIALAAVSYTHLDVYKRQAHWFASPAQHFWLHNNRRLSLCVGALCRQPGSAAGQRGRVRNALGHSRWHGA